jgi:trehalose/maltose transport system substrate-binding protein
MRTRMPPNKMYAAVRNFVRVTSIGFLLACSVIACRRHSEPVPTITFFQSQWLPPDQLAADRVLAAEFSEQTHISLRHLRGVPAEALDQLDLVRKLLKQPVESPDVMEVDETWLGSLHDDLADVRPYFPEEAGAVPPALASSYIFDGKVVALPWQIHAGVLEYRADLLRKYGYDRPPATWTELEQMAARIQRGERAAGTPDFWGYTFAGAAEESLTCHALEWQFDEGGGRVLESNGTVSVNNPAAVRSWMRARHWIGWIAPPAATAYREVDVAHAYDSGKTAFVRVWAGTSGESLKPGQEEVGVSHWQDQPYSGETRFSALPGGSVARASTMGGQGLIISRRSQHPQQAAVLIRFLRRRTTQSFSNGEFHRLSEPVAYGTGSPQENPGSNEASHPILLSRPTEIASLRYDRVSKAYAKAVHSVLTGEVPAQDAARQLETELIDITGLHPGKPEAAGRTKP